MMDQFQSELEKQNRIHRMLNKECAEVNKQQELYRKTNKHLYY